MLNALKQYIENTKIFIYLCKLLSRTPEVGQCSVAIMHKIIYLPIVPVKRGQYTDDVIPGLYNTIS